jgi:uncharacterized protein (DUF885 family)
MRFFPSVLVAVLAVGLAGCSGSQKATKGAGTPDARALAIADALLRDTLEHSPDTVALLRPPGFSHDRLPDDSVADRRARDAREDAWTTDLDGLDRHSLSPRAGLAFDIARETLSARHEARVCRSELWGIGQMTGYQVRFANVAQAQPVGNEAARKDALARFSQLPRYVDTQIANLREGLDAGYSQAAVNVQQVIDQLGRLVEGPVEASPFYSPALRDPDPAFVATWAELVKGSITPALAKYRDFLLREYLLRARKGYGVDGNRDGAACYRASIRSITTVSVSPEDVHGRGKAELERITGEMQALSRKKFGTDDVPSVLKRLATDPAYLHKSRETVTAQANDSIARAKKAMPRVFSLLPTADVIVEPIPAFQEKTSSAHYLPAALDGSRPATYRIRLYEAEKQSVVTGESTAFHETVPGHHLQINIANQRTENPDIARYLFNSGFGEGWALYAERLADELGLYTDDESRIGMLSNAAWRAVRLIVDSGLHAFGWDRERAVEMLLAHTTLSRKQAEQEIDRYISWPGQATAYMIGYMEMASLRRESEAAMGSRFDLRTFHDRVLENGAVPLPVLRRNVSAWSGAPPPGAAPHSTIPR